MKQRQAVSGYGMELALRAAVLFLLTEFAAACLLNADSAYPEQLLARAVLTLLLATLLLPQPSLSIPPRIGPLVFWSLLSGVSLISAFLWLPERNVLDPRIFLLAGGAALLVFMFSCFSRALAFHLQDRRLAARGSLAILLLGLTLPLWASPLAVIVGARQWFVDSIVALCPASYLARLAGIDYLRGDWMYRHTPYGSLRFDYPGVVSSSIVILILAALFFTYAGSCLSRRKAGPPATAAPKLLEIKS